MPLKVCFNDPNTTFYTELQLTNTVVKDAYHEAARLVAKLRPSIWWLDTGLV